jgi:hypothetical protein
MAARGVAPEGPAEEVAVARGVAVEVEQEALAAMAVRGAAPEGPEVEEVTVAQAALEVEGMAGPAVAPEAAAVADPRGGGVDSHDLEFVRRN